MPESDSTPLRSLHAEAAAFEGDGVPRHYGDPEREYDAAIRTVAVVDRSHRARLSLAGRAPGQMLNGILTARVPQPPRAGPFKTRIGDGSYSVVLTPKGRMVTDLYVYATGDAEERFLLDVPQAGGPSLRDHLKRFLPPRFATVEDRTGVSAMLTVTGPSCVGALSECLGQPSAHWPGQAWGEALTALGPREYHLDGDGAGHWLLIARSDELVEPTFDVLGEPEAVAAVWGGLAHAGAVATGLAVFDVLRVEAGTPEFGSDMTEETLPPEAGIQERAIDHRKGCYTGQEVIVRIRDRGHVNRHLRGLRFEGDSPPPRGAELFEAEGDRAVGIVTSAVRSPRAGRVIGLGYARREIEPPAVLRMGGAGGPRVEVLDLTGGGWRPDPA